LDNGKKFAVEKDCCREGLKERIAVEKEGNIWLYLVIFGEGRKYLEILGFAVEKAGKDCGRERRKYFLFPTHGWAIRSRLT